MTITDLYRMLFGRTGIQDGNVIDFAEHGRVGDVSTGQGFKWVGLIGNSATIVSKTGTASSSGNNTLVAAGTGKIKVIAFSLTTNSTTAITCKFQDGAGGTDLWGVLLQAPTDITTGANLSTSYPSYLFSTSDATLLNLNLSSANTVRWSISYVEE